LAFEGRRGSFNLAILRDFAMLLAGALRP